MLLLLLLLLPCLCHAYLYRLVLPCLPAGDNLMYPTPYHDLSGWNIKSMTCGSTTFACAATYGAEKSTITWGHSNGYRWVGVGVVCQLGVVLSCISCAAAGLGLRLVAGRPTACSCCDFMPAPAFLPPLAPVPACTLPACSELGYGPAGKKSSANPDKCMALEGAETLQVNLLAASDGC